MTTDTPAPDAGHATEPVAAMSNEDLLNEYFWNKFEVGRTITAPLRRIYIERADEARTEILRRLASAPAHTGEEGGN